MAATPEIIFFDYANFCTRLGIMPANPLFWEAITELRGDDFRRLNLERRAKPFSADPIRRSPGCISTRPLLRNSNRTYFPLTKEEKQSARMATGIGKPRVDPEIEKQIQRRKLVERIVKQHQQQYQ